MNNQYFASHVEYLICTSEEASNGLLEPNH
jgi:hypothetical protein